jgi:hypothetical protein
MGLTTDPLGRGGWLQKTESGPSTWATDTDAVHGTNRISTRNAR